MQGDSKIISIFQKLGVETIFNKNDNSILLRHLKTKIIDCLSLNLNDTPDIAQTLAVTCFGLGIPCKLEGLKTLKIKETDLTAASLDAAVKTIAGSARSMGLETEGV